MYRRYWRPWYWPCRCGFGPHAYGFWHTVTPLEELEAIKKTLEDGLEHVKREIERVKSEKT